MLPKYLYLIILLNTTIFNLVAQSEAKISFYQSNKKLPIKKENMVSLKKQPFSIQIPNKKYNENNNLLYATQIAILDNKNDLNEIAFGNLIDNVSYFQHGTGFATDDNNKYPDMHIGTDGHHYIYYSSAMDNRINLVSETRNEYVGEWTINGFYDLGNETSQKMQKLKQKTLYFVVFRNQNLDKIIDENEVEIYTLRFF